MLKQIKRGTKMLHIPTGEIVTIVSFRGGDSRMYMVTRPDGRQRSIPLGELTHPPRV